LDCFKGSVVVESSIFLNCCAISKALFVCADWVRPRCRVDPCLNGNRLRCHCFRDEFTPGRNLFLRLFMFLNKSASLVVVLLLLLVLVVLSGVVLGMVKFGSNGAFADLLVEVCKICRSVEVVCILNVSAGKFCVALGSSFLACILSMSAGVFCITHGSTIVVGSVHGSTVEVWSVHGSAEVVCIVHGLSVVVGILIT